MGTNALVTPNTGMNTKLCSLKYTPNTETAVSVKAMRILFMPESHHAADALHDDGGQAHLIDALDGVPVRPEAAEVETHLMVFHMVDADAYGHAAELADDRGPGRALPPPWPAGPASRK